MITWHGYGLNEETEHEFAGSHHYDIILPPISCMRIRFFVHQRALVRLGALDSATAMLALPHVPGSCVVALSVEAPFPFRSEFLVFLNA